MKKIRIGSGAGYAGDRIEPAVELMEKGNLDYIIFECLAERTVAIGQQDKEKDPSKGYNQLLDYRMEKILPLMAKNKVKVITNMGAANPVSAAERTCEIARKLGVSGLKIACVTGDDITDELDKYENEKVLEEGTLLKEKKDYIYRNYRHAQGESILFPGCNFPSFYPKTTKRLVNELKKYGIGVAYDCCGKPIVELGMKEDEKRIIGQIQSELHKRKIKEVIMLCPNCYAYLKPRMEEVKVVSIYEKLEEFEIGKKNLFPAKVFLPCPDREKKELLGEIERYIEGKLIPIEEVQCCGLGGCAPVKEPELAKNMGAALKNSGGQKIYSYCASCAGNLNRNGSKNVTHILTEILETDEKADTGKSMLNRMKTKFI